MTRLALAALVIVAATLHAPARSLLPPGRAGAPPRAAAPADTGCDAYGPGFRRLAGSDTCVKIGGSVRVETGITTSGGSFFPDARR